MPTWHSGEASSLVRPVIAEEFSLLVKIQVDAALDVAGALSCLFAYVGRELAHSNKRGDEFTILVLAEKLPRRAAISDKTGFIIDPNPVNIELSIVRYDCCAICILHIFPFQGKA
jgi:hypothetical protein